MKKYLLASLAISMASCVTIGPTLSEKYNDMIIELNTVYMESSFKSGIAGVYNPITNRIEWKNSFRSGVAGVFNPNTQKIEWENCL
jgi:hypothetical protein